MASARNSAEALVFGKILPVVVALLAIYSVFFTQAPKYVMIAIVWYIASV